MVRRCGSLVLSLRGMHKLMVRITIHVHVYHNMHYINIYYVRAQCHDIVSLGLLILISIITERTRPGCTHVHVIVGPVHVGPFVHWWPVLSGGLVKPIDIDVYQWSSVVIMVIMFIDNLQIVNGMKTHSSGATEYLVLHDSCNQEGCRVWWQCPPVAI